MLNRKFSSVELISRRNVWGDIANMPLLLLEENKHEPVYPYIWPWELIAHHLFSYIVISTKFS